MREDGEVTSPGAVDDWYNLLNLGQRYIAVGSSDSHGTGDEAGFFSTYVFTDEDDVRQVEERAFFQRMKERNVIATNGPFLRFWVNTPETPIGAEVVDTDGAVRVGIELTAAPWVSVTRINVVRNGVIAAVLGESDGLRADRDYTAEPFSTELELPLATNEEGDPADAWFVVQALGEQNYFPLVAPVELPPLDLTSALGAIAEPLGLDVTGGGTNEPSFVFPVTPFALTNPIWVRTEEGRAWQPPGVVPFEERTDPANDPGLDLNPVATSTLEVKRFDAPTPGYYTLREAAHHALGRSSSCRRCTGSTSDARSRPSRTITERSAMTDAPERIGLLYAARRARPGRYGHDLPRATRRRASGGRAEGARRAPRGRLESHRALRARSGRAAQHRPPGGAGLRGLV